jgi:uncharacterized protein YceH (UPF0502 family)
MTELTRDELHLLRFMNNKDPILALSDAEVFNMLPSLVERGYVERTLHIHRLTAKGSEIPNDKAS